MESSISKSSSPSGVESSPPTRKTPTASRRWRSPFVRKKVIRLGRVGSQDLASSPHAIATRDRLNRGRWLSFWLMVVCLLLGTGFTSTKWLLHRFPPTNCQELLPRATDSDRLYCLQQAVESGGLEEMVAAMNFVNQWQREHPLYSEGQRFLREWSEIVLNLARQELQGGNLADAVRLANLVPVRSPLYPEAQVQGITWQKDWQQAEQTAQAAKTAIASQDWSEALALTEKLSESPLEYWHSERAQDLTWVLSREKSAADILNDAEALATRRNPNAIAQALRSVQDIPADTHVKTLARQKQQEWSRTLLEITAQRLEQEDYEGAIATAKVIPHDDTYYAEAQDWIALSRASETAQQDDMRALLDALEVVQQIQPQSPLFPQAKMRAELWQAKIQG